MNPKCFFFMEKLVPYPARRYRGREIGETNLLVIAFLLAEEQRVCSRALRFFLASNEEESIESKKKEE